MGLDGNDHSIFDSVLCIAPPTLKRFKIEFDRPPPVHPSIETMAAGVFSSFPRFFPALQRVDAVFARYSYLATVQTAISRVIPSLKELRQVKLPPRVENETLSHVAQLPFLTHLVCFLPQDGRFFMDSTRRGPFFPSLELLQLNGASMDYYADIVQGIHSVDLRDVAVCPNAAVPVAALGRLFKALEKHTRLWKLCVEFDKGLHIAEGEEHIIRPETIKPLLSLRNLAVVAIHYRFSVELDDECVKSMALAWKHLTHLSIIHRVDAIRKTKATLQALGWLSTYCPKLLSVTLGLEPILPPPEIAQEFFHSRENDHPLHFLTSLTFCYYSPLEPGNVTPIAEYILNLFPNLNVIALRYGSIAVVPQDFYKPWDDLSEELSLLAAKRGNTEFKVRALNPHRLIL